ncbi:metalloprotease 1 [Uncinocarpus reesii 1704]|uniref:Extracellular metalloprotease UREG_07765 n=1 Tax=Uncinocarpus reesii (strain UAMH 1704) TaxID=336963 RepID=MEP1_UNCRE|nr:metalloprotease 1 [Uncinocarpus reesii 1704]C4K014.1 RecName: Full=Extracellular metalloprotease UREG_07765; Flags: Precursor [Uncinocarpus reesii 1704]EEP82900.1 metalloprotease 1 [Uncinocarpus reesii 1704]
MRLSVSLLALAFGSLVAAAPNTKPRTCGSKPSMEFLAKSAEFAAKEASGELLNSLATIEVETYFHVVASGRTPSQGYLSDAMLANQLRVMNSDYGPHGIQFNLVRTTRTVNANWARDGDELGMKRALRQGGYNALNVYFLGDLGSLLGYCYFPTNASPGSTAFIRDGCVVVGQSVPGGNISNYNLGKTATHEVGHWFGGCFGSGDGVSDTPPQRSSTQGCPSSRDSCPGGGVDPIHNYMDYSYDVCMNQFTSGQRTRIYNMWNQYRARG